MTKEAVLHDFWSSFGLPAYEENYVEDMDGKAPEYPYITYEVATDNFDGTDIQLTGQLWYRSNAWTGINAKANEISEAIGKGIMAYCDGGKVFIYRGHRFAQNSGDSTDKDVKRKILNIRVRFYTNN